jgi:hypothetical protein
MHRFAWMVIAILVAAILAAYVAAEVVPYFVAAS